MKRVQITTILVIVFSNFFSWGQELKVLNTKEDYYKTEWVKQEGHHTKELLNTLAPDFKLRTMKGDSLQLSDLKGKVVFMTTFFTICGGCLHEIPFINKLTKYYSKKDVVFIIISPYDTPASFLYTQKMGEKRGKIRKYHDDVVVIPASYLGKRGDGYYKGDKVSKEFKNMTKKLLKKEYKATMAPMSYFIDKKGIIRFIGYGYQPNKYDPFPLYTSEIDKLLAEKYKKN